MEKKYELVLVFDKDLEKKEREAVLGIIEGWSKGKGLTVKEKNDLGVKSLVYEMKGKKEAGFWQLFLTGEVVCFDELSVMLNRDERVWRYLILKSTV